MGADAALTLAHLPRKQPSSGG
jgi:hypothetical protein